MKTVSGLDMGHQRFRTSLDSYDQKQSDGFESTREITSYHKVNRGRHTGYGERIVEEGEDRGSGTVLCV